MSSTNETPSGIKYNIFRFEFSQHMLYLLEKFAILNKYVQKQDYKEAWEQWIKDHEQDINEEEELLRLNGYKGNINDKMYRSARYYFRKKDYNTEETKGNNKGKKRTYINVSKILINNMNEHIINCLNDDNDMKPSDYYEDFIKKHHNIVDREKQIIQNVNSLDIDDVEFKIKKTYKNRYFMITRNK